MRWKGQGTREMRNAFNSSIGKLEGKRPFRRLRRSLGGNSSIKIDLKETV